MPALFTDALTRRRTRAAAAATGALAQYYRTPAPADSTAVPQLDLLALDLECTSLDLARAHILSIGWVPVSAGRVHLAGSERVVVNAGAEVGDSAVIHGITDEVIATGIPLAEALEQVLAAAAGRVLLAHHAVIETTLLSRACEQIFGAPFLPPVIDTLALQRRLLGPGRRNPDHTGLNLWQARQHYGLPRYRSHDALTDAVACGELFLAQIAEFAGDRTVTLKTLRRR